MARKWQPRELRLLSEYLAERYPNERAMTRVRLGSLQPRGDHGRFAADEEAALGVWRRWADAIVIAKAELILIEAAIRPDTGEPSKLEIYRDLIPLTPELEPYRALPVQMELVYAVEDPVVTEYAERRGIRCVQFAPPWLLEYFQEMLPRERRAPQERGLLGEAEEKK